ncbi:MAG: hypothetical protein RLZZ387_5103 [Chloroflexota bacterium]
MPNSLNRRLYTTVALAALGIALLVWAIHTRPSGGSDTAHLAADAPLLAGAALTLSLSVLSLTALTRAVRRSVSHELGARERDLSDELRRTALLTRLSIELRETDDPRVIIRDILTGIAANTGAARASVLLVGPDGSVASADMIAGGEVRPIAPERARRVLERGLAGWALRHGRSVVSADLRRDERWVHFDGAAPAGSAMALPLTRNGAALGVLTVVHARPEAFTSKDLLLLEGVAAQAGVAICAAQRYAEEQLYREQALLLFSMGQFLTARRSDADLAAELLEKSSAVFPAHASALFLADHRSDDLSLFVARSAGGTEVPASCRSYVDDVAHRAFVGGEAVTLSVPVGAGPHAGSRIACVALPLLHSGSAIGAYVLVHRTTGGDGLSARVWAMLTTFTNVAAAAFANVRMLDQLHQRAEALERQVGERTLQLQRSRDLLRVIFDGLPDGLLLVGADETVLTANSAFCAGVLGLRPQDVVGRRYPELLAELERREHLAIALEPSPLGAARARRTDIVGQVSWYDVDRYTLARSPSGVEPVIERWRDVTRQQELHDRLLAHEQLSTLGRLAASVVHEVGNPLQSVRSCVDLCREDPRLPADAAEYLALADGELGRIASLLERLRQLYRAPQQAWEPVSLNDLAAAVQQVTSRQLLRHRQTLELGLTEGLPTVYGQPDALRQVMINLVLSGQELLAGPGAITITTATDYARRTSRFSVRWAGEGLSPDRARLLVDTLQSKHEPGGDLGLYLSQYVVRQHQGTIDIACGSEAGLTVCVTLPWSTEGRPA